MSVCIPTLKLKKIIEESRHSCLVKRKIELYTALNQYLTSSKPQSNYIVDQHMFPRVNKFYKIAPAQQSKLSLEEHINVEDLNVICQLTLSEQQAEELETLLELIERE